MPDGDRREIRTEAKTRHKAAQRITGASLTVDTDVRAAVVGPDRLHCIHNVFTDILVSKGGGECCPKATSTH